MACTLEKIRRRRWRAGGRREVGIGDSTARVWGRRRKLVPVLRQGMPWKEVAEMAGVEHRAVMREVGMADLAAWSG